MSVEDYNLATRSERLYYLYARAIDDGDIGLARSIVTDDVEVTLGVDGPTLSGVAHFLDIFHQHNARLIPVSKHSVSNVLAERVGDRFMTHAYFQACFFEEHGTRLIFGIYQDIHVEVGNELKIAHKKINVERVLNLPASSPWS